MGKTGNTSNAQDEGFAWQVGIWDRMAETYVREIDRRFVPVLAAVLERAELSAGQRVLDLGTGTGSLAIEAARLVGPDGQVIATDISPEMREAASRRFAALGLSNAEVVAGRAEALPAEDGSVDVVLASLSLMYVIDRAEAAREIARVLRPGGRMVAAVWAGPEDADIVRFQQTAGGFAPKPPVPGVGPGALGDPGPFLAQLADAGLAAESSTVTTGFRFDDFATAWEALASVTAAALAPDVQKRAMAAVQELMWPGGDGPRDFANGTHIITAAKPA